MPSIRWPSCVCTRAPGTIQYSGSAFDVSPADQPPGLPPPVVGLSRMQAILKRDGLLNTAIAALQPSPHGSDPLRERGPPPSLRRQKPPWWAANEVSMVAIDEFDERHHNNFTRAKRVGRSINTDPTSSRKDRQIMLSIYELATHRYVEREKLQGVKHHAKRERVKKIKWRLVDSIWSSRRKSGTQRTSMTIPQ